MTEVLEFVFWFVLLLPLLLLAVLAQVKAKKLQEETKNERERLKRVKDLYPDPPSYEERIGVRYGPQGASGATGGADNG